MPLRDPIPEGPRLPTATESKKKAIDNLSDASIEIMHFLQKTFGSEIGGTRRAIDWLIENQHRMSPDVFAECSEVLVVHEAEIILAAEERIRKAGGSVLPPVDQGTDVIDLTGSGSATDNPRVPQEPDQTTDVVDLTVEDDYARLKANQKAGKYVGKFKPFGKRDKDDL